MSVINRAQKITRATAMAGVAAIALLAANATPALAHSHVSVGIGIGFPVFPAYGYGGYGYGHYRPYGPYYRGYYRPYYPPVVVAPPAVVYAPPPVVYAPPPAVVYQQQPVQVTPTSDVYRTPNGQYCREYQSQARINGQFQNTYGTACQGPDGVWRMSN